MIASSWPRKVSNTRSSHVTRNRFNSIRVVPDMTEGSVRLIDYLGASR
jgi:hypothetical protein